MFATSTVFTLICALLPCQVVEGPTGVLSVELYHEQTFAIVPEIDTVNLTSSPKDSSTNLVVGQSSRSGDEAEKEQNDGPPADFPSEEDPGYPIVQISDGYLKGFTMRTISNRSIYAFKNIPFAEPPTGQLRFEPPVKNAPWSGIRDAMEDSPTCIQADYLQQYRIHGVEDCLYLNVYSPKLPEVGNETKKDDPPLAVMVWIHGGGWFFSTSSLYGPAYLLDQNVILVTINYRLSMLGFLSTGDMVSPGNNGLKDQTLALAWVRDNIAAFGGDSNKVTIFGESAGGGSVHLHMVSPLSRGLFHGGISQSGCATCFWSITEQAPSITRTYSALLNCTGSSANILDCLKGKEAKDLVSMQLALLEWTMYPVVIFGPVLEPHHPGSFLSEKPEAVYSSGGVAPVPWISGVNADEGGINIAVLFLGNGSLDQINSQWDKYGPIFLDLKASEGNNSLQIANKVKRHYLEEDNDISSENKGQVIKMFGDRYVVACSWKGIQLHATHSPAPVYAYRFSYRGKYSIVGLLGEKAEDWGVSHLDDLIYLFNNTEYYPTLSREDEEFTVSQIITGMWANFARTGKPHSPDQIPGELGTNWTPVSADGGDKDSAAIELLDISREPRMIRDPFQERVKFWRSLDLQDI